MAAPTTAEIEAAIETLKSAVVTPVEAKALSVGQALDADVAALKVKVAVLEANVGSWFKANWIHLVNSSTLGYLVAVAKHLI